MKNYSERQKEIIRIIYESNYPITGKRIAEQLGISLRSLQSEIAHINYRIKVIDSTNKGYTIDPEQRNYIQENVILNVVDNTYDEVIKALIFENHQHNIDELADELYMSTSTLENKLRRHVPILTEYGLTLKRANNCISIIGKESDRRKFISHIISEEIQNTFYDIENLHKYFPEIDVERIRQIVLSAIDKHECYVEDIYQNALMINITIALYRMKNNYYVSESFECDKQSLEYKIAEDICEQYANHWRLNPTDNDISYISTLLTGQIKSLNLNDMVGQKKVITNEFIKEINQIVNDVFAWYMLDIDYSDYIYNFALHMDAAIKRAKLNSPVSNDMLTNLKKNCPFIYDVAVNLSREISNKYNVKIVDEEIGLIGIHIGYLIQESMKTSDKINVLLYSNEYHHIVETIHKQLVNNYSDMININEVDNIYHNELFLNTSDLVITTKPLSLIGKEVITISPFYTTEDNNRINIALYQCLENKEKKKRSRLFSTYFNEKLFFNTDEFSTDKEVINFLSNQLYQNGYTDIGFCESVLKREELSSTCFFNTFALPHSMTIDAKQTICCVLLSKKGINWNGTKIGMVLMIAVSKQDRKEFMTIYEGIVKALENPDFVNRLVKCESYQTFINMLKNEA